MVEDADAIELELVEERIRHALVHPPAPAGLQMV